MAVNTFAILSLIAVTLSSCTKKESSSGNDGAKFVGTWTGTSSCSSGTGHMILAAGSNGNTVTMEASVGDASCYKAVTVNLTASGNNLTMPAQTFTDLCGQSYTFSGAGTLSGNTITMTFNFTGAITATCNFTGTK